VPGQVYYNSTRKLVLQGVDGVIFVADSDGDKMAENIESYENLIENLTEYGKDVRELPHVIQYNKRDHPNALSVEEIDRQLNRFGVPTFEAVAVTGEGVFPTLKVLAGMVLESIDRMDNRRSSARTPRPAATNAPQPAPAPAEPAATAPQTGRPATRRQPAAPPARRAAAAPTAQGAPRARRRPPAGRPAAAQTVSARPTPSKAVARAVRQQARPTQQGASRRGLGAAFAVLFTVVIAAAVAGVVYFVMQGQQG
jgi:hypothetical protein